MPGVSHSMIESLRNVCFPYLAMSCQLNWTVENKAGLEIHLRLKGF